VRRARPATKTIEDNSDEEVIENVEIDISRGMSNARWEQAGPKGTDLETKMAYGGPFCFPNHVYSFFFV